MGRGGRSVHGDMHSRETEHCLNMNGDEEPLPEPEERRTTKYVSAGNLFDGTIEDGHRVFRANLRRYRRLGIYTVLCGHHQLVPGTAPANADIRTTLNIYGDVVTDEVSQANLFPDGPGQFVWT